MPNGRLIEAIVRKEMKFGWEVLNEQNKLCIIVSDP